MAIVNSGSQNEPQTVCTGSNLKLYEQVRTSDCEPQNLQTGSKQPQNYVKRGFN